MAAIQQAFVFDDNSKENSKPLKSGRAPGSTFGEQKRVAFGSSAAVEKARADKRAEHLRAIEASASTEKPLAAWLEYIRWIQAEYPTGGLESDLLPSLERVTRLYANDPRFKNDSDYIKLWVTYADLLADPGDVFRYMRERGIGSTVSLYYMAWAWLAEHRGDFSSADQIYSLGINCGAQPLDRLKLRYKEFQRRMYKKWLASQGGANTSGMAATSTKPSNGAPAATGAVAGAQPAALSVAQLASLSTATGPSTITGGRTSAPSGPSNDENGRSVDAASLAGGGRVPPPSALVGLGYDHLSGLSAAAPRAPLGQVSEAGAALSYRPPMDDRDGSGEDGFGNTETRNGVVQMRRQPQPQAAQPQTRAGAGASTSQAPGFAVFEEEAPSAPSGGLVMGHSSSSSSAGSASQLYPVLPTEKEKRKENTQQPLKWTDPAAVLPPRPGSSSSATSSSSSGSGSASAKESAFLVYEEDNDDDGVVAPAPAVAAQKASSSSSSSSAAVLSGRNSAAPAAKPAAVVPASASAPVILNPRLLEAAPPALPAPALKAAKSAVNNVFAPAPVVAPPAVPAPAKAAAVPVAAPAPPSTTAPSAASAAHIACLSCIGPNGEEYSYEEERAKMWFARNPGAKAAVESYARQIEDDAAVARAKAKQQEHRAALASRGALPSAQSSMMMSLDGEEEAPAPASPIASAPAPLATAAAANVANANGFTFGLQGMSPIAPLGDDATAGGQTMRMKMMMTQHQRGGQYQLPHTIHQGIGVVSGPTHAVASVGFVPFADTVEEDDVTRASAVSDFGKEEAWRHCPLSASPSEAPTTAHEGRRCRIISRCKQQQ
jgi:Mad3/BUB1 homology region 1